MGNKALYEKTAAYEVGTHGIRRDRFRKAKRRKR